MWQNLEHHPLESEWWDRVVQLPREQRKHSSLGYEKGWLQRTQYRGTGTQCKSPAISRICMGYLEENHLWVLQMHQSAATTTTTTLYLLLTLKLCTSGQADFQFFSGPAPCTPCRRE